MIEAQISAPFARLIRRLTTKAETLATQHVQSPAVRRDYTQHHWRSAEWLWPDLFKD